MNNRLVLSQREQKFYIFGQFFINLVHFQYMMKEAQILVNIVPNLLKNKKITLNNGSKRKKNEPGWLVLFFDSLLFVRDRF